MEVFDAIHGRTSADTTLAEPLPRSLIEKLLLAGVQAPNHYKVRPWRFVVLQGAARERLGDAMVSSSRERRPDLPPETWEKIRKLPLRSPVVIAVGVDKPSDSRVIEIENVCAAAAACQNILLAAEAEGLAAKWRTGEWARDSVVKEFLGFAADQYVVSFLYIGYRAAAPESSVRPTWEDRTVWME
jgi:nitroreductase